MKANGRMTKHMEWDITSMPMELPTMESGRMISSMERVLKPGLTQQNMKDSIMKVKNTEKVLSVLLMVASTLVISSIMRSQERASMCGQMENPTKVSGRKIRCMATAF
jgi:hypothetical protein